MGWRWFTIPPGDENQSIHGQNGLPSSLHSPRMSPLVTLDIIEAQSVDETQVLEGGDQGEQERQFPKPRGGNLSGREKKQAYAAAAF